MQNYMMIHMMLRVEDAQRSVKFYEDAFGFHVTRKKEKPDKKFDLIYLSDDDENFELELTYNYGIESYEHGTAYGHLAIGVPDIYAACDKIRAAGGQITREPGPVKGGSSVIAFVVDPDGYKIELIERAHDAGMEKL